MMNLDGGDKKLAVVKRQNPPASVSLIQLGKASVQCRCYCIVCRLVWPVGELEWA